MKDLWLEFGKVFFLIVVLVWIFIPVTGAFALEADEYVSGDFDLYDLRKSENEIFMFALELSEIVESNEAASGPEAKGDMIEGLIGNSEKVILLCKDHLKNDTGSFSNKEAEVYLGILEAASSAFSEIKGYLSGLAEEDLNSINWIPCSDALGEYFKARRELIGSSEIHRLEKGVVFDYLADLVSTIKNVERDREEIVKILSGFSGNTDSYIEAHRIYDNSRSALMRIDTPMIPLNVSLFRFNDLSGISSDCRIFCLDILRASAILLRYIDTGKDSYGEEIETLASRSEQLFDRIIEKAGKIKTYY